MSHAGTGPVPRRSVRAEAADGVGTPKVTVAMMMPPTSEGLMPAFAIASDAASSDISRTPTSAPARWRVMMPVRCRIHSSDESIGPTRASLGTACSDRYPPMPAIREYVLAGVVLSVVTGNPSQGVCSGAGVGADEFAGAVDIGRRLDGEHLDALHGALGEAGEGAAGHQLEDARHAP